MIHNLNFESADYKTITVCKLREILKALPDDWEIWANSVRNLSVGDGATVKGFIDIAEETFVAHAH